MYNPSYSEKLDYGHYLVNMRPAEKEVVEDEVETPEAPQNHPPTITGTVVISLNEDDIWSTPGDNPEFGYFVYDFDATDIDGGDYGNFINWSIQGIDADKFYMDTWTGQLFLSSNPDYEKSLHTFEVIASDGIDQSTKSITLNIDDDEALQGIGTYWEIQEDNNLHWIDLGKNIHIAIDQSDFYSGSSNSVTGFQWGNELITPAQVNFETLSDGNIVAVWAADIWKDLGGGSWNSDYDLFYRIFNPADGTFITDEIRITDDTEAQYIEEIQTFSDGAFEVRYADSLNNKFFKYDVFIDEGYFEEVNEFGYFVHQFEIDENLSNTTGP